MDRAEIKLHLQQIIANIAEIRALARSYTYEDFRKDEQMRENLYEHLQLVGQSAHKLIKVEAGLEPDISADTLAEFRNARYNDLAEIHHQNVWNLVELDLPVIANEIKKSSFYNDKEKITRLNPEKNK